MNSNQPQSDIEAQQETTVTAQTEIQNAGTAKAEDTFTKTQVQQLLEKYGITLPDNIPDMSKFTASVAQKLDINSDLSKTLTVDEVTAVFLKDVGVSLLIQALVSCSTYQLMYSTDLVYIDFFGIVFLIAYAVTSYVKGSFSNKSSETSNLVVSIALGALLGMGRCSMIWFAVAIISSLFGTSVQLLIISYQFDKKKTSKSATPSDSTIEVSLNTEESQGQAFDIKVSTVKNVSRLLAIAAVFVMYIFNRRHYLGFFTSISIMFTWMLTTQFINLLSKRLSMEDLDLDLRGAQPNHMAIGLPARGLLTLFN